MFKEFKTFIMRGNVLDLAIAVIIGGARITGGHGTLTGTVLGVVLIQLVNNCLNTVGIPTYWQRFVVGMVLVIGTSLTSYQALKEKRKLHVEISPATQTTKE